MCVSVCFQYYPGHPRVIFHLPKPPLLTELKIRFQSTFLPVNHNNDIHRGTDNNESNERTLGTFSCNTREQKRAFTCQSASWFLSFGPHIFLHVFHIRVKHLHQVRWASDLDWILREARWYLQRRRVFLDVEVIIDHSNDGYLLAQVRGLTVERKKEWSWQI